MPNTLVDIGGLVAELTSWLGQPAEWIDSRITDVHLDRTLADLGVLNEMASAGDDRAFHAQQLMLARINDLSLRLPSGPTGEGSTTLHRITRLLEQATMSAQDALIAPALFADIPTSPERFVRWLKGQAREHRAYRHSYYREFIRNEAGHGDLRRHMIQESVVDGRFDDLLAMMQVGTAGREKLEIAANYWDEMGNGNPEEVHTTLFEQIFQVFDVSGAERASSLTANALLSGNLAVTACRYRKLYPEAVGYLGMTEWLVPGRFADVVHAWERLGLPEVGIVYHKLHITVDAQHASGWFHNVIQPSATSDYFRRGMARGALWRLNSSVSYLDELLNCGPATLETESESPR